MRRYAVLALVVGLLAATVVLGITQGRSAGALTIGAIAVAVVLAHLAFTTWGPNATPNRFYRRDLWKNERRAHKDLRRHRREYRDRLAGRSP